jgi:hypothetical protein
MHWTRKTIYVIIAVILLAVSLYTYINNIFLPVQFKRFITAKAGEALHRTVTIREIHFRPVRGFVFQNVTVYQKDDPARPFLQAEEVALNFIFVPSFKKPSVIIPSVSLLNPFIHLIRYKDGSWNFSDILPSRAQPSSPKTPRILVRKIIAKDGEIAYTDKTSDEEFMETADNVSLDARVSLNRVVRFLFEASLPRREGSLRVKGTYHIGDKQLLLHGSTKNIPAAKYASLFWNSPDIAFKDGTIKNADFSINQQGRRWEAKGALGLTALTLGLQGTREITVDADIPNLALVWHNKRLEARGLVHLSSLHLNLDQDKTFYGKMTAEVKQLAFFQDELDVTGTLDAAPLELRLGENNNWGIETLQAQNISLSQKGTDLRIEAALNAGGFHSEFTAQSSVKGDIVTQKTTLVLNEEKLAVHSDLWVKNGAAAWAPRQSLQGDFTSAYVSLTRKDNAWDAQGNLKIKNGLLRLGERLSVKAEPDGAVAYHYRPKDAPAHQYAGSIDLTGATVEGVPYVEDIHTITGRLLIETDKVHTEKITFNTKGTDIELSGALSRFADPLLEARGTSPFIDLERVFKVFPFLAKESSLGLTGQASVEAGYKGPIRRPAEADILCAAEVRDTSLTLPFLPERVTDIAGRLDYQKDLVSFKNLRGTFQKTPYRLDGQLKNFSRPVVDIEVNAKDLAVSSQIRILHDAFQLTPLTGKYLNTTFNLKGDVHLWKDAPPDIDLRGQVGLDLEDLAALPAPWSKGLERLKPQGILSIDGLLKGTPADWQHWRLTFTAVSPALTLNNIRLEHVELQHEQRDENISKCNLRARVYNGDLSVISSADIRTREPVWKLAGRVENLDLAQLRQSKGMKNQYLAGKLTALLDLNGPIAHPDQLLGTGTINISDGYLWRLSFLDNILGELLIPEFTNIVFTDAQGTFTVKDGKVWTGDARVDSNTLGLKANGWVDFNQNMDVEITPVFGAVDEAQPKGPLQDAVDVLTPTDSYVSVQLTGPLSNPKRRIKTFPGKILEKTTDVLKGGADVIKEGVGAVLKEIF